MNVDQHVINSLEQITEILKIIIADHSELAEKVNDLEMQLEKLTKVTT